MAAALGQSMVAADVYQSANLRYSKGLSQLFSAGPRVNIPRHGTALLELKSHHTKPNHHLYTEKAHKILCNECLK
ncbi:LOW QUALITY PROTEIN: hypothetical protein NC653_010207 [Populus alba x Populus x berolinensis]|uniref:Uncharacterized protein n=1 Tax=Populus alba x Populus x berolinensis TaxID=444605 RepID=A0AAD6QZ88_9ROSI|nr:LOW QUALITY PROTEIN: hypothetical protein NC653_010207 [Populus alba x Populus x berolinensis]